MRRFLLTFAALCPLLVWAQPQLQPDNQVSAQLLSQPGQDGRITVGLALQPNSGWHTYWENPGDAGLATRITWQLPEGATAGPIQWPAPTAYAEGELVTYGYGDAHTLLTELQVPPELPDTEPVLVEARWLVCKDICIPEQVSFDTDLGALRQHDPYATNEIARARREIPENLRALPAAFNVDKGQLVVSLPLAEQWWQGATELAWFPAPGNLIKHAVPASWSRSEQGLLVRQALKRDVLPEELRGVLVIQRPDGRHAVELVAREGALPASLGPLESLAEGPPTAPTSATSVTLWLAMVMAFVGGLILNLMPCVFPVLALKAMSLTRAESLHERRVESLFYAAGVLVTFLGVAAVLLALRASGAALGWGFQLQNPVIVGLLAMGMVVLALAMAGWTQIGMSWMGWGQNLTAQKGHRGAFFTGALAVVVASPCSAPFMGGALGYAVVQPAPVALTVFASLGLGLAAPFVLVAWVPALAHRLPRPGPWMDTLKTWMSVPLALTGVWLFWVLWRQSGSLPLLLVLAATALLALVLRESPERGRLLPRWPSRAVGTAALALAFSPAWLNAGPEAAQPEASQWQPWSAAAVAEAQREGRMIFVDFTADWCLSCIVNERSALASGKVQSLVAEHDVLMLKADWTRHDPAITAELARFGRNGVPLYLLYGPGAEQPEVLPQLLTPGLVSEAIRAAASGTGAG